MSMRPVSETLGGRLVLALAMMAAVMTIQAIFGASPAQALTERPGNTYTTNGKVYATALSEDGRTLYIGGQFSEVRERPSGTTGKSLAVDNVAAIAERMPAATKLRARIDVNLQGHEERPMSYGPLLVVFDIARDSRG